MSEHGVSPEVMLKGLTSGNHGNWAKLNRGDITTEEFGRALSEELSEYVSAHLHID